MKQYFRLIFQAVFLCTLIVNAILIFFFITVYDRFNGRKSLNPKEFLFSGVILLVLTIINILYYKNKNFNSK
jgi:hypothetical protein